MVPDWIAVAVFFWIWSGVIVWLPLVRYPPSLPSQSTVDPSFLWWMKTILIHWLFWPFAVASCQQHRIDQPSKQHFCIFMKYPMDVKDD